MACQITLGRIEPCKDSIAGIDAVYFLNDGDITGFTYDVTNTDAIETVTGNPYAYKYDVKGGNNSFEQTIVSSRDNGTTYWEQKLTLNLKKLSIADHKELKLLVYGNPQVIVKDNNDNFFLMGLKYGADVTGGTVATGAAMGDFSGYTLELTAMEPLPANFFEATTEAGLVTAGFIIVKGNGQYVS